MQKHMQNKTSTPRIVIIGAGFGGLAAALKLAREPVEIVIIDRQNYHLFQPLLYQVATAALSPADIAAPIRSIVRKFDNIRVVLDTVTAVQRDSRHVETLGSRQIEYDYLIIATGATHNYFGHDEWQPFAPGLKRIEDATDLRRRILLAFERAEIEDDAERRTALMTFVIVGAGPTGVEMAGAVAELTRHTLARDFRRIRTEDTRILLVDNGERILRSFPEPLSEKAHRSLESMGVELMLNANVDDIGPDCIRIGPDRIPTRTVVWSAGVKASPVGQWLTVETDRAGRVAVDASLLLPGDEAIYVIGDACTHQNPDGQATPGLAPAAKQQGQYVARDLKARLRNKTRPAAFQYRDRGQLATIGRHSAICDFGRWRLSGYLGWWLWGIAHIYFLISFRNRLLVAANWLWSYLTFGRGIRLITGDIQTEHASNGPEPERPDAGKSRSNKPHHRITE